MSVSFVFLGGSRVRRPLQGFQPRAQSLKSQRPQTANYAATPAFRISVGMMEPFPQIMHLAECEQDGDDRIENNEDVMRNDDDPKITDVTGDKCV